MFSVRSLCQNIFARRFCGSENSLKLVACGAANWVIITAAAEELQESSALRSSSASTAADPGSKTGNLYGSTVSAPPPTLAPPSTPLRSSSASTTADPGSGGGVPSPGPMLGHTPSWYGACISCLWDKKASKTGPWSGTSQEGWVLTKTLIT